ncbi:MAG TPA: formate dehydrogenase accessory sulfurtransferase FdhD [Vicinamibacterales bacterium]|nr:formate dehydrogenase accessory sulfurtransferase FdhD [Vicinamibacterales bacterium]
MKTVRIGISSCLLGDEVRFDGGHKRDAPLLEAFAPHVEWVRVCPEVEIGMGVPREPVRLLQSGGDLRMIAVHTGTDHTEAMRAFAARRVQALAAMDLRGYVLKSDSPSCGLHGVKVFDVNGGDAEPIRRGTGLFAAALTSAFPDLPIAEERQLADPASRASFLDRVSAYDRASERARAAPPESLTPSRPVSVLRVSDGTAIQATDRAAAEEPLDIRLHGRSFAVIMRTPGQDRALAAGFLLSERIIRSSDDIAAIEHCRHPDHRTAHHVVDVFLRGEAAARVPQLLDARRQMIANSSCGVCGRATIDELREDIAALPPGPTVDLSILARLPQQLRRQQSTFDETGGLHAAAVFTADGSLLAAAEDVGRHNAVDKVIGASVIGEVDAGVTGSPGSNGRDGAAVLVVSGRVAFEIVQKAWLGRVPIIVAISAPTSLAVELALEARLTLLGFVRDRSLNIYTHADRVGGLHASV